MAVMKNGITGKVFYQHTFYDNIVTCFDELCDFYASGFEMLPNVTTEKKIEGGDNLKVLYIYLTEDRNMYIKLYYGLSSNVDIHMDVIKNGTVYLSSACGYTSSNYMHFYFFISDHGIIFTIPNRSMGNVSQETLFSDKQLLTYGTNNETTFTSFLNGIFVQDNEPTIFWNFTHNNIDTDRDQQYQIFSLKNEDQETIRESTLYFAKNFGSQKILLIHAYSFDYPINTPHLYRVLGISNDTATGRISVSGKTLFWIGRFALEFNE